MTDAVFSPDGRRVVTAGSDGATGVWDWSTGRLVLGIPDAGDGARVIAVSPDGSTVAVGDATADETRLWKVGD